MAAAIALAVVLVIAVAGMSLAMQAQRPLQPNQTRTPRMPRSPRPPVPGRVRRTRERPSPPPPPPEPVVDPLPPVEARKPELLTSGIAARAKIVSVVDERVVGPVTRSRLTLEIEPQGGNAFEVTIRHAFPTAEARARVRVGGQIAVRYDKDEHRKVVIDTDA